MAIARVQASTAVEVFSGGNAVVTFGSPPAAGNLILVGILLRSSTTSPGLTSVTDNQGNTYHQAIISANANGNKAAIYYAYNIGATVGTFTITVDPSAGNSQTGVRAIEYSGFGSADPLVGISSATGISKTPATGSTGATGAPEVAVMAVTATFSFTFTLTGITVETVVPAWTEEYEIVDGVFNHLCGEIDTRIVASSGTESGSWALSVGGAGPNWSAAIAAFYASPAIPDTQLTQMGRQVLEFGDTTDCQLTQMARQVLYPFTCTPTPPGPPGVSPGCPAAVDEPPVSPAPGCATEV